MLTNDDTVWNAGRFSKILRQSNDACDIFDKIICESHNCVVTPTLGSILPNWLLIIPRQPVINFASWKTMGTVDPVDVVKSVLKKLNVSGNRAIWFEHGATVAGSTAACGVDQAHLHIIIDAPFSFEQFTDAAAGNSHSSWNIDSPEQIWGIIDGKRNYLIASDHSLSIASLVEKPPQSQFFRRIVADLVGKKDSWDYNSFPHFENIAETLRSYGAHLR